MRTIATAAAARVVVRNPPPSSTAENALVAKEASIAYVLAMARTSCPNVDLSRRSCWSKEREAYDAFRPPDSCCSCLSGAAAVEVVAVAEVAAALLGTEDAAAKAQ